MHLGRASSYLESSYQKVSTTLKHEIGQPIPVILYKTHSEFEQTNLGGGFIPEGVLAFAEPVRGRMVMPIDEPPDKLQGLITHELTHIFEFDIIPRSLVQRTVPLWLDEGLADYMRGNWDTLDLMTLRDAAVTDQIPKMSRFNVDYGGVSNARLIYNLGHAAFEFIEARYGKEGIRQFLYTFRKNIVGGGMEDIYQQAFRTKPEEFDEAFDKWLKERFKPFRDKQRPSDYGKDLAPDSEKTTFTQVFAFSPSPSGEVIAALTGNRSEGEADIILLSARDGAVIRNLTKGYNDEFENVTFNDDFVAGRNLSFDPAGRHHRLLRAQGQEAQPLPGLGARTATSCGASRSRKTSHRRPACCPDGQHALYAAIKDGVSDIFLLDMASGKTTNLTQDAYYDDDPQVSPDGKLVVYTRRISGHNKVMMFALDQPAQRTQLTFGVHDDTAPTFSPDGHLVYYSSNEDDDIPNVRSLDLAHGRRAPVHGRPGREHDAGGAARSRGRAGGLHQLLQGRVPAADDRDRRSHEGGRPGGEDRLRRGDDRLPARHHPRGGAREQAEEADVREDVPGGPSAAQHRRDQRRRLLRRQPDRPHRRAGRPQRDRDRHLGAGVPQLQRDLLQPVAALPLRLQRLRLHPVLLRVALRPADELLPRGCARHPALPRAGRSSASTRWTSSIGWSCRPAS